jgi:hypothetical protein
MPTQAPGQSPEAYQAQVNQMGNASYANDINRMQGANNTTRYDDMQANAGLAEVGWHQEEDKNLGSLKNQLLGILKDKGAATAKYHHDYKQQDFENKLANRRIAAEEYATMGESAAQAAKQEADAAEKGGKYFESGPFVGRTKSYIDNHPKVADSLRDAYAKNKGKSKTPGKVITSGPLTSKTDKWVRNHPDQAQALVDKWNASHGDKPKDKGKLSPTATRRNRNDFNAALDHLRLPDVQADVHAGKYEIDDLVTEVPNLPHDVAKIMLGWAKNKGHISPQDYRALRKLGIPDKWLKGHVQG